MHDASTPDGAPPPDAVVPDASVPDAALDPDARAAACSIPGCGPETAPAPDSTLRGVWVGEDVVWALGEDGMVGRRLFAGGGWCWCAPDPAASLQAIWGTDDDDVWIVGGAGRVLHWDGTGFAVVDLGTTAALTDVWASSPANVFVVGDGGIVRHFDGHAWSATELGPERTWRAIWGASADDVWLGGSEPAPYPGNPQYDGEAAILYRWQPATGTWLEEATFTMYYGAAGIRRIHGSGPDNVWAEGLMHPAGAAAPQYAAFHRGGAAWTAVIVPETPEGQNWFTDVAAVGTDVWLSGGTATRHFDGAAWELLGDTGAGLTQIDGRPGEVWAVGWPAKIVRWDGARWVLDE